MLCLNFGAESLQNQTRYCPCCQLSVSTWLKKKNSIKLVDLSNILWALKRKLYIRRGVSFDFNTMQHVVEILQVVLDELKVTLVEASHSICNTQKIAVFCNTCYCFSVSEENLDIVTYQYQLTSKLL